MTLLANQASPEPIQDTDAFSFATTITPPETIASDLMEDHDYLSGGNGSQRFYSVLEPGSTYIIRPVSSRDILTLLMGQVVLAQPGGLGSPYWECVETEGWFGFRNLASYAFLGRDIRWKCCCTANNHLEWEKFSTRPRSEGGHVLLMTHWGKLRPIGIMEEGGAQKLAMIDSGNNNEVVWEFMKV